MKKIAINGFGRIGRLAFRELIKNPDIEIVAINDLTDPKTLAHLLKYDTAHGPFDPRYEVTSGEKSIILKDKKSSKTLEFSIFSIREPKELPWGKLGVDCVLECTGRFVSKDLAQCHIDAGAKKVVISAPAKGDLKTIVYNVNHKTLTKEDNIISAASCTTNALAPVVDVLNKNFGLVSGFMTTIHAYTADQRIQDSPHSDLRRARCASTSIIPTSTGAATAIGKVIPELQGKLDGVAHRVPVVTGSLVDLTVRLDKKVTEKEINEKMKKSSNETLGYCEDPIVSADIISSTYGSIFDSLMTKVLPTGDVKLYMWYDNESSYVNQLVRTVTYFCNF